jgi:hypothetical protein
MPSRPAIWTGPSRFLVRRCLILASIRRGVRRGEWWGRLDRSTMPDSPSSRYRSAHRFAVVAETWNRSAARRNGQPSSTMQRASLSRPLGVRQALAWDMKTSGL